jgi:heme ABC exporter ATP-binding subunit CcmA
MLVNENLSLVRQQRPALEARNLSVVRGNRVVIRAINLTLAEGEIVALVGSNGAGKTTLLQCLAGAVRPAGGEVLWQGKVDRRCPAALRLVGFVGHESGLYLTLTARENLLFAGRMWGVDSPEERALEWLSLVGLEDQARQTTAQLSRGMRQRLAIARALIHDPIVVLLDEPFTNLDGDGRKWLTAFLRDLRRRNRAVLLAAHESPAGGFVDRLVCLQAHGLREMQPSPRPKLCDNLSA